MTYRLQASTQLVTLATSGSAAVAVVDVLDRHGPSAWAIGVAVLLALGALLSARLHGVGMEVAGGVLEVRNVLATHRIPAEELAEIRPGPWRSAVVLRDGTEITTLLSERDLSTPTGQPRVTTP